MLAWRLPKAPTHPPAASLEGTGHDVNIRRSHGTYAHGSLRQTGSPAVRNVLRFMPVPRHEYDQEPRGVMAKNEEPVTIKKYANRRLYNTGTSTYVTLEDLAVMVKEGEDFVVYDAKTGDDITRSVLTQIIFEQENKGTNLLPITFLRQVIRFYGDSMQTLLPRYLEVSIDSFTREQEKLREQMSKAFGGVGFPVNVLEDQVRRNMEMFERAFAMFLPFAQREAGAEGLGSDQDIDELKRQVAEMQKRLERLTERSNDKS
jgi:polyhydroxyalkanoate synthesis repressor PhaR